jgi:hypothetical protein
MAVCPNCGRLEGEKSPIPALLEGGVGRWCEVCEGTWWEVEAIEIRCPRCKALIDTLPGATSNVLQGGGCRACKNLEPK